MNVSTSILLISSLALQEPLEPTTTGTQDPVAAPAAGSVTAEGLRSRIHGMRMNLLVGGDRVKQAENEAIGFYGEKAELIDQRLDSISVDLSEKRATYDVALDRALEARRGDDRKKAMQEAGVLRSEITSLESESTGLSRKRGDLTKLVAAVEARDREREKLVAQLETSTDFSAELGMPLSTIGLAPAAAPIDPGSPLDDDELVRDLLERDPRGARGVLFDMDPIGYWRRFPLVPPEKGLRQALKFPLPDLPGKR